MGQVEQSLVEGRPTDPAGRTLAAAPALLLPKALAAKGSEAGAQEPPAQQRPLSWFEPHGTDFSSFLQNFLSLISWENPTFTRLEGLNW